VLTTLNEGDTRAPGAERREEPSGPHVLHRKPPARPASLGPSGLLLLVALAFVGFAVAAGYGDGEALRKIDEPIVSWVEGLRSAWLTRLMVTLTDFGGNPQVFTAAGILALVACRRCRPTAVMILVMVASRPGLEWLIKEVTDRERPEDSLLATTGDSFPSGHVLAAILLWALLPAVVTCFTDRRRIWWATVAVSGTAIAAVAASRIYLGVHWPTDVFGSILLGAVLLYMADRLRDALHGPLGCRQWPQEAPADEPATTPGARPRR
jgi:undecaprenyl-diphosphatase